MNLPFNEQAGKVNPQTVNITLSFTNIQLPGRAGMNFSFGKIWALNQSNVFYMYYDNITGTNKLSNQTLEKYNHLGVGWSASLPYIFQDLSTGEMVLNLFLGGQVYQINKSGIQQDNPEESNLATDQQVADTYGDRSKYELIFKDNSRYYFREDGRLLMQQDKTGLNRIWYFYDSDQKLFLVVDTIGRKIRFSYTNNNLT